MNKLITLATALCLGPLATLADAAPRTSEVINRDWAFTLGNPAGAETAARDTSHWRRADLAQGNPTAAFRRLRFLAVTPQRPARLSEVQVVAKPKNEACEMMQPLPSQRLQAC